MVKSGCIHFCMKVVSILSFNSSFFFTHRAKSVPVVRCSVEPRAVLTRFVLLRWSAQNNIFLESCRHGNGCQRIEFEIRFSRLNLCCCRVGGNRLPGNFQQSFRRRNMFYNGLKSFSRFGNNRIVFTTLWN